MLLFYFENHKTWIFLFYKPFHIIVIVNRRNLINFFNEFRTKH